VSPVGRCLKPVGGEESFDQRVGSGIDLRLDVNERFRRKRAHQHLAAPGVCLVVAEQGGVATEVVAQSIGRYARPAAVHRVVAQRGPHVCKAANRVHPVPRQPDDRTGLADAREHVAGVCEHVVRVQVHRQRGRHRQRSSRHD
jgi:hypothetical protein